MWHIPHRHPVFVKCNVRIITLGRSRSIKVKMRSVLFLLLTAWVLVILARASLPPPPPPSPRDLLSWTFIDVRLKKDGRPILQLHFPGSIKKGRLTGLIGPSGCGKSTLLSLLAGRLSGSLLGPLLIKADVTPTLSGPDVAFLHQDDAFFSMLTVTETLKFSAALRLLNSTSSERSHAISEVLKAMALTYVQDSPVGDAVGTRGISGGERKRLSVACELLSKPRLLLADEPTTSVDSYQSIGIVRQIKAVLGPSIGGVVTLHQPRSLIWHLLDDIILLANGGRCVYQGSRAKAVAYFSRLGHPCPADTNPAEHLIDLVSVDYTSAEATRESRMRIDRLVEEFAADKKARAGGARGGSDKARAIGGGGGGGGGKQSSAPLSAPTPQQGGGVVRRVVRSARRFLFLLQRAVRQTFRDNGTNAVRLGVSAILAVIVSAVYGRQDSGLIDPESVGDRVTIIAQAAIQVSMLAMLKALSLFKREKNVVSREIATHQYGSFEYLLSKLFAELPVDAFVAALFALVVHDRTNLHCQRRDFVGVLSLLGCASSSLGLAISALAPTGEIALAIGPALMVTYVIAGAIGPGKAKKGGDVSLVLRALRAASPIRPACEALCAAEFRNQQFAISTRHSSLFSALSRLPRLLRRGGGNGPTAGDRVLQDLALDGASLSGSKTSLVHMVFVHSCLALVGLILSSIQF